MRKDRKVLIEVITGSLLINCLVCIFLLMLINTIGCVLTITNMLYFPDCKNWWLYLWLLKVKRPVLCLNHSWFQMSSHLLLKDFGNMECIGNFNATLRLLPCSLGPVIGSHNFFAFSDKAVFPDFVLARSMWCPFTNYYWLGC